MKTAIILTLSFLFATRLLFALCLHQPCGLAEEVAAILPEIPEVEETTDLLSDNSINQTESDSRNQYLLPAENSGYHLEFDAEKGITLAGATAADLLDPSACLTFNFSAKQESTPDARIQVLINDQSTAIRATTVTAALRQIPAERIKAIDITTDPSDNSDPADEANIIIRVTKIK